jgi:uncharacterized membrane protein (UPF0127 family)
MPLESPAPHPSRRRNVKGHAFAALTAAAFMSAACSSDSDVAAPDSRVVVAPTVVASTVATEALADIESGTTVRDVDVQPAGFTTAMIEVTKVDGTVCELCMWLADTGDERGQGLKGVTSLGAPEGMAFVWDEPTTGSFFMFQTVTPLSIAWFDAPLARAGGALVSTADMEPCVSENSTDCERFSAGGDYVLAIEVFQGDLASIGITAGSTARLLPETEATNCPLG